MGQIILAVDLLESAGSCESQEGGRRGKVNIFWSRKERRL